MATVGVRMCHVCRRSRQKCKPPDRIWIEGGQQQKCDRCTQFGHECGPNEHPPRRPRAPRSSQGSNRLGTNSQVSIEATAAPVSQPIDDAVDMGEVKRELQQRLRDLEKQLEVTKRLDFSVGSLDQNGRQDDNEYHEQFSLRNANVRILSLMPAQAEALADRLVAAGEIETAEGAYNRILNAYRAYRGLDIKAWHEVKSLVQKMADLLWRIGEPFRAENLIWDALASRDCPPEARALHMELLKALARSLLKTSEDVSTTIQSTLDGSAPSHLSSPFPPLQRMMQSTYASTVGASPFHQGEFPETSTILDVPIVGGIEAVLDFLRVLPVEALVVQDINGQSPLFFAASRRMEGLGRAILLRLAEVYGPDVELYTNSRDLKGDTVLGASICAGCSVTFVRHLIDRGAKADPDNLMQPPLTPLQAAAFWGYSDILEMLLERGANIDRVFPGNRTALIMAEGLGHEAIARRLNDAAREYSSPHPALAWPP